MWTKNVETFNLIVLAFVKLKTMAIEKLDR